jgi:formate hydrogenlyase transcriptional activator
VIPVTLPPLRERREDVPLLVDHFLARHGQRTGKRIEGLAPGVLESMQGYDWPGNVRELENAVERAVILTSGSVLQVPLAEFRRPSSAQPSADGTLQATEREAILKALRECQWVIGGPAGAARRLGIKRTTLHARMEKLGIVRPKP